MIIYKIGTKLYFNEMILSYHVDYLIVFYINIKNIFFLPVNQISNDTQFLCIKKNQFCTLKMYSYFKNYKTFLLEFAC